MVNLQHLKGVTPKRTLTPALMHCVLRGGELITGDGIVQMTTPTSVTLNACPTLSLLLSAMQHIGAKEHTLSLTAGGQLEITSAGFKTVLPTIDTAVYPFQRDSQAPKIEVQYLRQALRLLAPFVGTNAHRYWCTHVNFTQGYAYATNNMAVARVFYEGFTALEGIQLPSRLMEIVRNLDADATHIACDDALTVYFGDDCRVSTPTFRAHFPDLSAPFDNFNHEIRCNAADIPKYISVLTELKPFLADDKLVYFNQNTVSTHKSGAEGTSITHTATPFQGVYQHAFFLQCLRDSIGMLVGGDRVKFIGDNVEFVLCGITYET